MLYLQRDRKITKVFFPSTPTPLNTVLLTPDVGSPPPSTHTYQAILQGTLAECPPIQCASDTVAWR